MLYVEDVLELIAQNYYSLLAQSPLHDDWSREFIENVSMRIKQDKVLSSAQSAIIVKMFRSVCDNFVACGHFTQQTVDRFLSNPSHRRPPYQSQIIRREVRYLGVNLLGFRFKYDKEIMDDLRSLITDESYVINNVKPYFDQQNRIWIVPIVNKEVLLEVRMLIRDHKFEMDIQTRNYLTLCECSVNKPSTVVYDQESQSIIGNVCDNPLLSGWMKHVVKGEYL